MHINRWFKKKSNTEASKEHLLTLNDITLGVQQAATSANSMISQQYLKAIEPFFNTDEKGKLHPKMLSVGLDNDHHFDLPLVALFAPRGLILERMKVFLTVRANTVISTGSESLPEHTTNGNMEVMTPESNFIVSLSSPTGEATKRERSHVDIEMEFSVLEPPESVMRMIDEYTRNIFPIKNNQE